MKNQTKDSQKGIKFSFDFLITIGVLVILAAFAKPMIRWLKAEYDTYRERNTTLTASTSEYQRLLKIIQSQQPKSSFSIEFAIPEKFFKQLFLRVFWAEIINIRHTLVMELLPVLGLSTRLLIEHWDIVLGRIRFIFLLWLRL